MNQFGITEGQSLIEQAKLNKLVELLHTTDNLSGAVIEVGVYMGGSALLLAQHTTDRLYLFDTFEGMPNYTEGVDKEWKVGSFKDASYEHIKDMFAVFPNVSVHKGIFPTQTGKYVEDETFRFIHLDVDNYQSYQQCLDLLYPKLVEGGIIVFDDYGSPCCPGAKKAVDEFFGADRILFNRTAYIIK